MLRVNRLISHSSGGGGGGGGGASFLLSLLCKQQHHQHNQFLLNNSPLPSRKTTARFLDIYQLANKDAIEKEKARLQDEMSRGYFDDINEFRKHGGKIAVANKVIVPAVAAMKFPDLEVSCSDGGTIKLPVRSNRHEVDSAISDIPQASLLCLSFRASSQVMINSWSVPFLDAFRGAKNIQLYEVSFIDSWLLCRSPVKQILLRILRKSDSHPDDGLQRQIVYSFGDHYYFRKELKILNLLTGYIFLLDKFGRLRWQGFGLATEKELSSLISCTSYLLEEK